MAPHNLEVSCAIRCADRRRLSIPLCALRRQWRTFDDRPWLTAPRNTPITHRLPPRLHTTLRHMEHHRIVDSLTILVDDRIQHVLQREPYNLCTVPSLGASIQTHRRLSGAEVSNGRDRIHHAHIETFRSHHNRLCVCIKSTRILPNSCGLVLRHLLPQVTHNPRPCAIINLPHDDRFRDRRSLTLTYLLIFQETLINSFNNCGTPCAKRRAVWVIICATIANYMYDHRCIFNIDFILQLIAGGSLPQTRTQIQSSRSRLAPAWSARLHKTRDTRLSYKKRLSNTKDIIHGDRIMCTQRCYLDAFFTPYREI